MKIRRRNIVQDIDAQKLTNITTRYLLSDLHWTVLHLLHHPCPKTVGYVKDLFVFVCFDSFTLLETDSDSDSRPPQKWEVGIQV